MHRAGRKLLLADLRARIEGLEGSTHRRCGALPFDVPAIDKHLPGGGLALGVLHEFAQDGIAAEHAGLATLFVAGVLARMTGPVIWCLRQRDLFQAGLASVGLHPDRVIYVETYRDSEVLPAMEEGLRHGGLAAVVGEVARLALTPSRRLQRAAGALGVTGFVIRRWRSDAERASSANPTASATRWRISAAPSAAPPAPGLNRARWLVELTRCKGAEPRSWVVEACDEAGRLGVPADVAHRSRAPDAGRLARAG
jgi:protein ImuA